MNNPSIGGLANAMGTATAVAQSEISIEQEQLDKAIQATFDSARNLAGRLQSVCRSYPHPPNSEKSPEEALSDFGATLRRNRRSVEGINDTLTELLQNLAL